MNDDLIPWFLSHPNPREIYREGSYVLLDFETDEEGKGSPLIESNDIVCACWQVVTKLGTVHKSMVGGIYDMQELLDDIASVDFLVAMNAKFELGWLKRCGMELRDVLVYDPMLAQWALDANQRLPRSLQGMARRYGTATKIDLIGKLFDAGVATRDIHIGWLVDYCAQDVEVLHQVMLKQLDEVDRQDIWHLVHTRNLTCSVLADIEFEGLVLDKQKVYDAYNTAMEKFNRLRDELAVLTGGINLNSPAQLAVFLYDTLGLKQPKDHRGKPITTPSGKPTANEKALALLKPTTDEQHNFLAKYKEFNKVNTLLTKNLSYFKLTVDQKDGKFYGILKQNAVETGRLASSGIPVLFEGLKKTKSVQLQNIPREFKPLFCSGDPDWYTVEVDGCFTAGHRILMEDLTWKAVENVAVGDRLVGLQEEIPCAESYRGQDRSMLPAVVEATRALVKSCIELELEDGTSVTVSEEHPFLVRDSHKAAYRWETAAWIRDCQRQVTIRKMLDVHEDKQLREWGKLAAYIDGEGSWCHDKLQLTQQDGSDVLEDMEQLLGTLQIPYRKSNFRMSALSTKPVASLTVTHTQNLLKIQQLARPIKAQRCLDLLWNGKCPRGFNVKVVSCKDVGKQEVFSLQTSTKTYVGEGLFSHNCQLEFRVAVDMGHDRVGLKEIEDGTDVHSFTAAELERHGDPEICSLPTKKAKRQESKKYTFKPLYGGGSGSDAVKAYCEYFKDKYAELSAVQRNWALTVADKGWFTTPYGMTFHFPGTKIQRSGYISNSTNIYNFPVQGFATGEIIPIAMVYFWHKTRNLQVKLYLTVHDSLISNVYKDDVDQVIDIAKECLTTDVYEYLDRVYHYKFVVPLGLEAKVGTFWSDGSIVERKWDVFPSGFEIERT